MFFVVEVDNDGFKVYDSGGTLIDPAKDATVAAVTTALTAIKDTDGIKKIVDPLPAGTNNIGDVDLASAIPAGTNIIGLLKVVDADGVNVLVVDGSGRAAIQNPPNLDVALSTRATEATLATRASEATLATRATEATLASIKDTDGIKKITDALPAGTNEIGKVAQGTKAAGTGAWPQVLYDAAGNAVGVVLDGSIYRIQADAKVAKGTTSSNLLHLEALDTLTGMGRLKTTVYTPDGDPVAFGAVSTSIKNHFVETSGGSHDLRVDGSTTPVVFTYDADATYDISVQEIKFTLVSNSIPFGSGYFGSTSGPLTNGVLVEVITNGTTVELYNLQQNESFVNFSSPGGFEWVVSSKDMMTSNYLVGGGVKLFAGTADKVRVTVRDNISSCGVYFKCFIKGNLLTEV